MAGTGILCILYILIKGSGHNIEKDKEGRYLILKGSKVGEPMTLVNAYSPNHNCPQFFQNVFLMLTCPNELIIASNMNLVLDPLTQKL